MKLTALVEHIMSVTGVEREKVSAFVDQGEILLTGRNIGHGIEVCLFKYDGVITKEVASFALDLLEVDKLGLDQNDRNILLTIMEKFSGGPVGLDTLAAAIGEDGGTIEDVYEPYLVKNGFINRTPKGRVVTDLAYRHFGMTR